MRIAIGGICHETNTFSPIPTGLDDFVQAGAFPGLLVGAELLDRFRGTKTIIGGAIDASSELRAELVPLIWTFATPSGTVDHQAYETLKRQLIDELQGAHGVDAILLDLHGAMVTSEVEDAEGDLIEAVRQVVGRSVPCVTTLDLHANITENMVRHADVLVGFDTYPHVDMYDRGVEATQIIGSILCDGWKPTAAFNQLPLITAPPKQCTLFNPMKAVIDRAHEMEERAEVINVTVAGGFPFADILDAGTSVVVTTQNDVDLARQLSKELGEFIWERRDEFVPELVSVQDAVRQAIDHPDGPVILADGSDNPGGGAPCDGTAILAELLAQGANGAVVAVIADPESVARCIDGGIGRTVELQVGGKTDDRHGPTVPITGTILQLTNGQFTTEGPMGTGVTQSMGRTAVVRANGVEIVITQRRIQARDTGLVRSVGIEPTQRKIIALKSAVHFRAAFGPIAKRIIEVDGPGVHSPNLSRYTYTKLRRPVYPVLW